MLEGATLHNLKDATLDLPLGLLTCVTGVSGSGKSSLVIETLARQLARQLHGAIAKPGPFRSLRGTAAIDRAVLVDQSPIGRTPRSNAATYTGIFDDIRKIFAGTKLARQRGWKIGRFSFNVQGGRCEECQGQGLKKIEMNFLPDLFIECPTCRGARFDRETLRVRYRDKSIAEVLELSIGEAIAFFENFSSVKRLLCGSTRSAWATCRWGSHPPRSPAARRSASSSPPNSAARQRDTPSTFSTSQPPGSTPIMSSSCYRCCTS